MTVTFDVHHFADHLSGVLHERWLTDRLDTVPNFWEIVEYGRDSYEIRNSKMLRWLLDPNGSHGLRDRFVRGLAALVSPELAAELNDRDDEQLRKVTVVVETPLRLSAGDSLARGRLDLLYRDESLGIYVAIENKTGSAEHSMGGSEVSQTWGYRDALQREYPGERGVFIYLASEGDTASDEGWESVSHQALFALYEELAADADLHTSKLIEDFHYDLRRKLDTSIDGAVGQFLFTDYVDTQVTRMTPSNSLWGVMALLPSSTWLELDSAERISAAEQHYLDLRRQLAETWPMEEWAGFATQVAQEFERRGLDVGRPVTPDVLQRVAQVLWEHRPMKVVDHSTDATVQELIRHLFTHFTGQSASAGEAPPVGDYAALCESVSISRGRGQGIQFDAGRSRYKLQGSARSQTFELMSLSSETGRGTPELRDPELGMRRTSLADWGYASGVWDAAVLQARAAQMAAEVVASRERVARRGVDPGVRSALPPSAAANPSTPGLGMDRPRFGGVR